MKRFIDKEIKLILKTFNFTNVIGLSRSTLATGTLLTLLFNPSSNFLYILKNGDYASPILAENSLRNQINFFLLFGNEYLTLMKYFACLLLILVISGFYPRITSFFHWWITWSFMLFSSAIDGGDQLANNISLLFIFVCLFDNRKNHWQTKSYSNQTNKISGFFFIQIIKLQAALVYFHASIGKLPVTEWANGTAVYYWFNNAAFGLPNYLKYPFDFILTDSFGVALISYGTIIFEIILFLCLTMPLKYRRKIFLPALLFHFSIIVVHGIFSFFFSMASLLIIYLLNYNTNINFKHIVKWRNKTIYLP